MKIHVNLPVLNLFPGHYIDSVGILNSLHMHNNSAYKGFIIGKE